jgi:DNA N-6-adenine-methyltransferase (Dam)
MPPTPRSGFSHERSVGRSVEWYTPPEVFEALGIEFDLDPAAPPGGVPWVPAARHFCRADDGLSQPWRGRVWLNPPYGRDVGRWLERLASHGDGLALVFARTDTDWFHKAFALATAVCFIKGRLRFVSGDGNIAPSAAGAPSMVLAYGLPCAMTLAAGGLGRTCVVPGGKLS